MLPEKLGKGRAACFLCTPARYSYAICPTKGQGSPNPTLTHSREAFQLPAQTKEIRERGENGETEIRFASHIKWCWVLKRPWSFKSQVREMVRFAMHVDPSISALLCATSYLFMLHIFPRRICSDLNNWHIKQTNIYLRFHARFKWWSCSQQADQKLLPRELVIHWLYD